MIWGKSNVEKRLRRLQREKPHQWFAWRPVQLRDGRFAWLQYVTREVHTTWDYLTEYYLTKEK